jgi:hypothetical protein
MIYQLLNLKFMKDGMKKPSLRKEVVEKLSNVQLEKIIGGQVPPTPTGKTGPYRPGTRR